MLKRADFVFQCIEVVVDGGKCYVKVVVFGWNTNFCVWLLGETVCRL
jgi:hypothetical protein